MNDLRNFEDLPRWYALYTHVRQECRAEHNLNSWGIETFNPRTKDRSRRRTPQPYVVRQLFPRYIFARFPTEQLHKITFTRGVQSVVSFGSKPAAVDEAVISLIKSRLGEEGFVCFNDELTTGDRVVITDGPLAHLEGIFERKLNGTKRVSILLFTVRLQSRLIIERDCVQKVERGETEIRPRTVSSERRACVAR